MISRLPPSGAGEPPGGARLPQETAPAPAVTPGERRTVVVTPDQVWAAPRPSARHREAGPEPARQTFAAPILLVTGLSALLLALLIAAVAFLVWLKR